MRNSPSPPLPAPACRVGQRHAMVFLLMIGMSVVFTNRVNMSVALVAMVNASAIAGGTDRATLAVNYSSIDPSCRINKSVIYAVGSHRVFPYVHHGPSGSFPWSRHMQGLVLSSYYWGYAFPLIPMAAVAHKWNSRLIFGLGVIAPSLLSLLIPTAAYVSVYALMALRALQGIFESITCPSIAVLLGRWIPISEASLLYNLAMMGALLGTIFGQLSAGVICDAPKLGWESVFYIHFAVSALWVLPWVLVSANYPSQNRWISAEEVELIGNPQEEETQQAVPWKAILRDPPVWAFIMCMGVRDWLFNTMLACLPQFLTDVLSLSVDETGLLAAIPYISNLIFPLIFSFLADKIMSHQCLNRTNTRKLFSFGGLFGTAICMFFVTRLGCREVPIVLLMVVGNMLISMVSGGFMPNAVDLSSCFCGVLFSMSNILSTVACILSPIVADELASRGTLKEWAVVFDIGSGLAVASALVFALFSSGYRRAWDTVDKVSGAVDKDSNTRDVVVNEQSPLLRPTPAQLEYGSATNV